MTREEGGRREGEKKGWLGFKKKTLTDTGTNAPRECLCFSHVRNMRGRNGIGRAPLCSALCRDKEERGKVKKEGERKRKEKKSARQLLIHQGCVRLGSNTTHGLG